EGYVNIPGARVFYIHAGSGPPMLLIHGLVGSSANWRDIIPALAQHSSVYAIDLVNMGRSQRVGGLDPRLHATARRIAAVMDALHLAQADIVAHSHGGAIALMLAALYPKRVRRLILFAPANPFSRSSDPMIRLYSTPWGGLLAWTLPYLPARLQRIALGKLYGGPDRVLDRCLQEIVHCLRNPGTLRHVLCILRCWFTEMPKLGMALRRIRRKPILLVWGDRDVTVSLRSGTKLHRKLHADLVVVPGCGHSVFEEMPEQSNRILLDWLAKNPLTAVTVAKSKRRAPAHNGTVQHLRQSSPAVRESGGVWLGDQSGSPASPVVHEIS
ncbi:MAG TPA: alpha/beta hydrolase, partial [Acidobacteriaceae bacterium]|nr:alpha/beta hydrolase [Acidobacteriaceae bacterium]